MLVAYRYNTVRVGEGHSENAVFKAIERRLILLQPQVCKILEFSSEAKRQKSLQVGKLVR